MLKNKSRKLIAILSIATLLLVAMLTSMSSALVSQNSASWFLASDTNSAAIAIGDVNADGVNEIVSAGYYNDGVSWNGHLVVLNSATMANQAAVTWRLGSATNVAAVAIGDVNGDGKAEIVTGGSFFDGTNWVGQVIVWNGTSLATLGLTNWRLGQSTTLNAFAVANVSGGIGLDIITGATLFDGVNHIGHAAVWNGTTLALERQTFWRLGTDTFVSSVAVANVSLGTSLDIVTGGNIFDGTNNIGQLILWNGTTLAFERLINWRLGTDTYVNSIAIANVSLGSGLEIVTGGEIFDGIGYTGQLIVWNGTTLATERLVHWRIGLSNTATSIALGNFSGGSTLDIVTAGTYNDTVRKYAQIIDWNSTTLASNSIASWFVTSDTSANSIAIGTIPGFGNRIIEGGQYWDNTRAVAQVTIWG